jgi:hypothetical protein
LSEYAKKQILCCDDMNNLAKTLPKLTSWVWERVAQLNAL